MARPDSELPYTEDAMLPIIVGLLGGFAGADVTEPPTDQEVLRALPRIARGIPYVWEEYRNDITIVKNRLAVYPVELPLFVGASVGLVKESWECSVYYDRVIQSDYPFSVQLRKPQVQVLYIDKLKLAK
jgi:hypothetical protein